ncbi:hypothetical protein BC941DRAFT_343885 [Chlamydoabsidia padenii]|nr:hypothetical protein BC941DRAFT_343885 [Chlamydoabsidia padenii]
MDMTSRYSRVMRIRTETPDEPLPAVPYEDGWNQVSKYPTGVVHTKYIYSFLSLFFFFFFFFFLHVGK